MHRIARVVAGNHVEHLRRVRHGAADRTGAHVDAGADHPVVADQFDGRRDADEAVHRRRPANRDHRLFADGTRHQVGGDGAGRPGARHARFALGVVRVAERAAIRAARTVDGVLGQVGLGQNDGAGIPQSASRTSHRPAAVVGVVHIAAGRRPHVEGVVLVLDRHDDAVQRAERDGRCAPAARPAPPRSRAHRASPAGCRRHQSGCAPCGRRSPTSSGPLAAGSA